MLARVSGQACGPTEYWDGASQACVPGPAPAPQCPPGQFYDYLRGACVPAAMSHATGALGDVTVGPHLVSPLGVLYAWGQGLGLWGQREKPAAQPYYPPAPPAGSPLGGAPNVDWTTVTITGLAVIGVLGLGYMVVNRPRGGGGRRSRPPAIVEMVESG